MKILVSGGTGLVGSEIVERLLPGVNGTQITVGTRSPRSREKTNSHVRFVRSDVNDSAALEAATEGQEVVIHCVQFPNHPIENHWRNWTYMKVDGEGTVRLVAAAKKNGVRRFIYLSGAGAGRGRMETWFQAKQMAENAIRESGMEYVIFRPSWIYGPRDHSVNRFVLISRFLPFLPVIGNGRTKAQPVYVGDVAEVVAKAVGLEKAANKIFEMGGPEELTMDEIMRTVLGTVGRKRLLLHHPPVLMKFIAFFFQLLPYPPLTPAAVDFLTMENSVDSTSAVETFGLKLRTLEEGLKSYLA